MISIDVNGVIELLFDCILSINIYILIKIF